MAEQAGMLLTAMASVILTWVPLCFIFTGVGLISLRVFDLKPKGAGTWLKCFWVGWALVLILLQIWHLWLPVDWRALTVISAIGVLGLLWHRRELRHLASRRLPTEWLFCVVMLAVAVRLANRAVGPLEHIDAGFYHLSSIRWAATYPIVPGLGNLNPPLAINCAHFLYVAMLDVGPWVGKSHHLANGLLLLVALAQVIVSIFRVCRRPRAFRVADLFLVLTFAGLWTQAAVDSFAYNRLFVRLVCSPTPDLPVFVLGVVLAAQLLAFLERSERRRQEVEFSLFSIAAVTAAGIMVKLTFAVFGATALTAAVIVWAVRRGGERGRGALRSLALTAGLLALALVPWMLRGIILSGYVAYPMPVGSVNVEWRVPHELVVYEANLVRRHARWNYDLGGRQWVLLWAAGVFKVAFSTVVLPCGLALAACCLGLYWRATGSYARRMRRVLLCLFAPPVVSALLWFLTGPSPRFAGAIFWVAAAGALAVPTDGMKEKKRMLALYLLLGLSAVLSIGVLAGMSTNGPGTESGFHPVPKVGMTTFVTRSGLEVLVPRADFYCWNAPLPCTPEPLPGLRLRREGDLSSGFVMDVEDPAELFKSYR